MLKNYFSKTVIFLTFLFALISVSCSNTPNAKLLFSEDDTLRTVIVNKENTINWSKPLEDGRLQKRIDIMDNIVTSIKLNPDVMNAFTNTCDPVYPYIENFATLNLNNLSQSNRYVIQKLFEIMNTNLYEADTELINPKYLFNYVFFISDIESVYKQAFGAEYPKSNAFSSYLIGEPFVTQQISQVPVRLYCEKGSIDICVIIYVIGKNLINQIEIIGWEVNYAEK